MNRLFAAMFFGLLLLAGCRRAVSPIVEGKVVDATIHTVTLETAAGETLTVSTLGTDPALVPGVLAGDGVRVAYELLPDGETLHALRLDITAPSAYRLVPGIWRDCSTADEVGLVLAEDGSARAVGLEDLSLQDWSLDGDRLVLTGTDPAAPGLVYAITRLDADSLIVVPETAGARRLALGRQP